MSGFRLFIIFGIILTIFGFVQCNEGSKILTSIETEYSGIFDDYFLEDDNEVLLDNWDIYLEMHERWEEGKDKQYTGRWLVGIGIFFIIGGIINPVIKPKK